jgi:hypothetical protein
MNVRFRIVVTGLCGLAAPILCALSAGAQTQEIKAKPPMYTYVANWQVPRAQWGDVDKTIAPVNDVLQKALDEGAIVGYGKDLTLVHQLDNETHDVWWSSMSLAGIVKTLDRVRGAADPSSPALNDSKHWDDIFVSHFYNWKPGAFKNAYTHVGVYQLREDAPDNGLDDISQHLLAPLLEKLLADGTILEYEIDTMAIHTTSPGLVFVIYLTPTPEGLDTVQAAIQSTAKDHPLGIQAFGSETVDAAHRDDLLKSDGIYK